MSAPVAVPAARLGAAVRFPRSVAAIVVLASAGAGYVGSCIWPLSPHSGLMMPFVSTGNTSPSRPEPREVTRPLVPELPKPAAVTNTSASFDVSSQLAPAVAAHLPEPPQIEADGSSSLSSAAAMLHQAPGQLHADGHSAPLANTEAGKDQRQVAARRPVTARGQRVRTQRTRRTESNVVEFAPNPRPDQALRDFMASASSNN